MDKDEHSEGTDPELERLQQKTAKGALNVVEALFQEPKFRKLIRRAIVRESLKSGIFLGFFIVGLMGLFTVMKTVYQFSWIEDLILSVVLLAVGLIYMLKSLK